MTTHIHGIGIANFRGIGEEVQRLHPLSKINILIGPNNAGKSTFLWFISHYLLPLSKSLAGATVGLGDVKNDVPRNRTVNDWMLRFEFCLPTNHAFYKQLESVQPEGALLESLLRTEILVKDRHFWFPYFRRATTTEFSEMPEAIASQIQSSLDPIDAGELLKIGLRKEGRTVKPVGLHSLSPAIHYAQLKSGDPLIDAAHQLPLIPAYREITSDKLGGTGILNGQQLIDNLKKLQGYDGHEAHLGIKWRKIVKFVQDVLSLPQAQLRITASNKLEVDVNGKSLPLSHLGTGVAEVVMLAAYCSLHDETVMCIEEIELHLHPALQKRLMDYLNKNTSNQYFITTHSAHIIDTEDAELFEVTDESGSTKVSRVTTDRDKFGICNRLGYRASDLLQANCIVWVEGPSDRIYVKHWIESVDASLVEGKHYSIMFYGGRLLSHLSGEDIETLSNDIAELILLPRINRHMAMVIDSDRKKTSDTINDTKRRVIDEFTNHGGFAWETKGRTIENYVEPEIMKSAIGAVHPRSGIPNLNGDPFEAAFVRIKEDGTPTDADKVTVAQRIVAVGAPLTRLDLKEQIGNLVAYIRKANEKF